MNEQINVAVIGCGIIGGALIKWIETNNSSINILKVDPPKGFNDDIAKADIAFISIHIPTELDGSQNLTVLKKIIQDAPDIPIFIRTTILPGTSGKLSKEFSKKVYFMPEFLTERTAVDDFNQQPMIFSGEVELLKKIFMNKKYITMTSLEAELTKYAHNVFGALKVTYFNGIYELSQKLGCNFENIRNGVLLSGYINEPHTMVPGPDGKMGYGGKCFPKDVNAFSKFLEETELKKIISLLPEINNRYREQTKKEENNG